MTVALWTRNAAAVLTTAGLAPEEARRDVGALVRGILEWDLAAWVGRQHDELAYERRVQLDALVARRAQHEPIAYLTGRREFYGRDFVVSPAVLIPRPETELVVDVASRLVARISRVDRPPHIVDVGTGSGIIAVTLAIAHPTARLTATDVSDAALSIARANAERHGVAGRITFATAALVGDERDVDLVVSNPPYVARDDAQDLQPEVRLYEPHLALFGGVDGLDVLRALIPAARAALSPGGWLVMEIGAGQAQDVKALVAAQALEWQATETDLAGHPRVVIARRRGDSL